MGSTTLSNGVIWTPCSRRSPTTPSCTSRAPRGSPAAPSPTAATHGLREYFADVERLWEELVLHATDYRAVPGSVIVMGHITGRRHGLDVRRSSVWTWKVADGRATSVKAADLGDMA